jgi:pyrroline-5-carboxylate reductase
MSSTPDSSPAAAERPFPLAFIGGGNMAGAIIGGLVRRGVPPSMIDVVEPVAEARDKLQRQWGVQAQEAPGPALSRAELVVWAVKPQTIKDAALQSRFHTRHAIHLSVAAGIRTDSLAHWLGTEQIVRCMPNTPALVGRGMSALFARAAVAAAGRARVEEIIRTTGDFLWVDDEAQIDAVTALSGSGPAYVFYFLEAMTQAGADMGLPRAQAYRLAVGTFAGASALAEASDEPPEILRQRVTSKGGTTYAAITSMDQDQVKTAFERAMHAAHRRARELGEEFGRD